MLSVGLEMLCLENTDHAVLYFTSRTAATKQSLHPGPPSAADSVAKAAAQHTVSWSVQVAVPQDTARRQQSLQNTCTGCDYNCA